MADTDSEPAAKKPKLDSYIPTEEDGSQSTSVIFSLKDEKGALAKALRAFEVKYRYMSQTMLLLIDKSVTLNKTIDYQNVSP